MGSMSARHLFTDSRCCETKSFYSTACLNIPVLLLMFCFSIIFGAAGCYSPYLVLLVLSPFFILFFRAYAILLRRSTSICMVWALVKGNWLVNGGYMALIGFSGMSMTTVQHTKEMGNLVGRV